MNVISCLNWINYTFLIPFEYLTHGWINPNEWKLVLKSIKSIDRKNSRTLVLVLKLFFRNNGKKNIDWRFS